MTNQSKLIQTIEKLERKAKRLEGSKQESKCEIHQLARAYFNAGVLSEKAGLNSRAKLNYYHASKYMLELARDVNIGAFQ